MFRIAPRAVATLSRPIAAHVARTAAVRPLSSSSSSNSNNDKDIDFAKALSLLHGKGPEAEAMRAMMQKISSMLVRGGDAGPRPRVPLVTPFAPTDTGK